MTRKLRQALIEQKQSTEQVNQKIPGLLGIPLDGQRRVEVPGRNAFVYVRLRNNTSEVIQAYNNKVAIAYNLPVLVHRVGGRYEVFGVDTERYDNNWSSFAPFLPRHGNTHSLPDDLSTGGGGDIVWVYPRQIMPALVFPSGSLGAPNVLIAPYTLKKDDGSWMYVGNTGTPSFLPYRPATGTQAVMALVYLDSVSGNPQIIVGSGTYFSNTLTGTSQIVPYIPSLTNPSHIPLAAIRLITGTNRIGWDNIYDARQWIHVTPTGSAGGGGTTLPVADTQTIVKGSVDPSKLMRFEVDGFTSGTTRVLTPPNQDITLAGQNFANVFTVDQIIDARAAAGKDAELNHNIYPGAWDSIDASLSIHEIFTGAYASGVHLFHGATVDIVANPSASAVGNIYEALTFRAKSQPGNTRSMNVLMGIAGFAEHYGSGTLNAMYGAFPGISNVGNGNIINAIANYSYTDHYGGGLISNQYVHYAELWNGGASTFVYGMYITLNDDGGSAGTAYGIYIDPVELASTNYALYTNAGNVRFGGPLQLANYTQNGYLQTSAGNGTVIVVTGTPAGTSAIQDEGSAKGNAATFNFVGAGVDVSISGSVARVHVSGSSLLDGPQGFGYNYLLRTTADGTSGTFTTSLKAIGNVDPSPSNPVILRIGETRRHVMSASNVVLTSGTNWMNCGGPELTTQNVDLFVYAIWESNQSAVRIGVSRIPNARTMGDFVNTSTDERYIKGNYSSFNSDDEVEVIGRVRTSKSGTLGAWGSSGGSVFSRPMKETDWLYWTPNITGGFSANPTLICRYKLIDNLLHLSQDTTAVGTSNSTGFTETIPFRAVNIASYFQYSAMPYVRNNGTLEAAGVVFASPASNILTLNRSAFAAWTASGNKTAAFNIAIEI